MRARAQPHADRARFACAGDWPPAAAGAERIALRTAHGTYLSAALDRDRVVQAPFLGRPSSLSASSCRTARCGCAASLGPASPCGTTASPTRAQSATRARPLSRKGCLEHSNPMVEASRRRVRAAGSRPVCAPPTAPTSRRGSTSRRLATRSTNGTATRASPQRVRAPAALPSGFDLTVHARGLGRRRARRGAARRTRGACAGTRRRRTARRRGRCFGCFDAFAGTELGRSTT